MLLIAPTAITVNVQGKGPLTVPVPVGTVPAAEDEEAPPPLSDSSEVAASSSIRPEYAKSSVKLVEREIVVDDAPPRPSLLSAASTSVSEEETTYGAGVGVESGTSKYTSTCVLRRVLGKPKEGKVWCCYGWLLLLVAGGLRFTRDLQLPLNKSEGIQHAHIRPA